MKKYGMLLLAFAFALSMSVAAQGPMQGCPYGGPMGGMRKEMKNHPKQKLSPKKRAGFIAVEYDLTDAQRDQLQALFVKQDKERADLKAEIQKLRQQEMAKRDAFRKESDDAMAKIMGNEKFQQLKEKQAKRMERMKMMRHHRMMRDGRSGFRDGMGMPMHRMMPPQSDQSSKSTSTQSTDQTQK